MSTTSLRVADRMHVEYQDLTSGSSGSSGQVDAQFTQQVSMFDASNVNLVVDLIAWKVATAGLEVKVILQQSNDQSNWFEVTAASGATKLSQAPPGTTQIDPKYEDVGMAYVRVVFIMGRYTGTWTQGDGAVLQCDLSTSL